MIAVHWLVLPSGAAPGRGQLARDEASFVHGAVLHVDGGRNAA